MHGSHHEVARMKAGQLCHDWAPTPGFSRRCRALWACWACWAVRCWRSWGRPGDWSAQGDGGSSLAVLAGRGFWLAQYFNGPRKPHVPGSAEVPGGCSWDMRGRFLGRGGFGSWPMRGRVRARTSEMHNACGCCALHGAVPPGKQRGGEPPQGGRSRALRRAGPPLDSPRGRAAEAERRRGDLLWAVAGIAAQGLQLLGPLRRRCSNDAALPQWISRRLRRDAMRP